MLSAAQCAGAGNIPAGVDRLIQNITAPKMNWREILRQQIQSTIKSDYSFLSYNKKSACSRFIMPGLKRDDTIDICVAIDTSGSIDDAMLQDALSEISGIMSQYDDYHIHVWSFDTKVHNPQKFSSDEGGDIASYKPAGGGGTDFMCNYSYMQDNDIVPNTFVMITDGYPYGSWGIEGYCETVFCINKLGKNIVAPFGTTVRLES